jgi:hypothetical protein
MVAAMQPMPATPGQATDQQDAGDQGQSATSGSVHFSGVQFCHAVLSMGSAGADSIWKFTLGVIFYFVAALIAASW